MTTLKALQDEVHQTAWRKGWHTPRPQVKEMLRQLEKELHQAVQDAPDDNDLRMFNTDMGNRDEFPSELGDILIRLLDIAAYVDIDLETVALNRLARMRA